MYRYLQLGHHRQRPSERPSPDSGQVLAQLRQRVRLLHCSAQTEASHLRWVRAFLRWLQDQPSPGGGNLAAHQPGPADANAFLAALSARTRLVPTQHRQALQALLFLYRHVWDCDLMGLD